MKKALWNGIEVVITSTTGNRVAVMSGTRVRIPPIPPQTLIKLNLIRVFLCIIQNCFSVFMQNIQSNGIYMIQKQGKRPGFDNKQVYFNDYFQEKLCL